MSELARGEESVSNLRDERFDEMLRQVSRKMEPQQFRTWFADATLRSWAGNDLVIGVPNGFFKEWFQNKFQEMIRTAAEQVSDAPVRLRFEVVPRARTAKSSSAPAPTAPIAPNPEPVVHTPPGPAAPLVGPGGVQEARAAPMAGWDGPTVPLNPYYLFENFVTGPSNEMAYASSRGVANEPGATCNPLFIYGSVGLGKTHLLHAIGNTFRRKFPTQRMCFLSCEEFTNAFIQALERSQVDQFRNQLRHVDLLVIDDIHFLANKERTQEEFFNTFNRLHQVRCQIVLSSDAAPSDIPSLKERLVSRFNWGLVTCLEQPETETRMAIVRRKAELFGMEVPNEVVELIASNFRNNIRELEGALQSIRARAEIERAPIDLTLAERALGPLIKHRSRAVDLDTIIERVCAHHHLKPADLKSRRRTRTVSAPRQIAMYLARKLTDLPLQEIGARFGGRDHTTVLFSVQKTEERMESDPALTALVERFLDQLGGR